MISRRRDWFITGTILAGLVLLERNGNMALAQDDQCTLCVDSSPPDMSLMSEQYGWSCTDLTTFASILKQGENECTNLQIIGFQDCGCPTLPSGLCTLCPGGFSDIPDRTVSVPSTTNLTCGDILFVEEGMLQGGCGDLAPYRDRCGCPTDAECSFCKDGGMPMQDTRVLRYLSTPDSIVTCGQQASEAFAASTPEQCEEIVVAPVAVDGQGYCGCEGTSPSNLCTLCPEGGPIVNADLVVPNTNGMTCLELEEYLRYVTDEDSCNSIAAKSQVCCNEYKTCPVCGDANAIFNKDKAYSPYGLTCENIGNADDFGFPMTCSDVQLRFPYYCECPGAEPMCTLCQLGEIPPETDKDIPLLGTTCQQVNDYSSLRLISECVEELASHSFDASAYCGCPGFDPPMQCQFCPEGEEVTNQDLVPPGSGGATCGELADFSDYVRTSSLCASVQSYALACCRDPDAPTITPTVSPPTSPTAPSEGTAVPTIFTALPPTVPGATQFPTGRPIALPPTGDSSAATQSMIADTLVALGVVATALSHYLF